MNGIYSTNEILVGGGHYSGVYGKDDGFVQDQKI